MIFRLITCGKCMINRSTSTHFSLSNKRNYLLSPLRLRDLFIKSPILMSSQIFSKFPSTYSSSSPIRRRVSNISLLESVGFGILVAIGATEYFLTNEDIQEMVDSLEQRDSRWLAPVISGVEAYFTMRKFAQEQVKVIQDPYSNNLLPALHPDDKSYGVLTVVLDLDETLVCIDWKWSRGWIVSYRPGVQTLLQQLGSSAEVVVYTDLSSDDARKIVRMMDVCNPVRHVLTQNANKFEEGKYYRDLSKLNRDLSRVIYISGHALENSLQLENCVPIKAWKHKEDSTDTTLVDLLPFLESVSHDASDVREIIRSYEGCEDVGLEFSRRERQKQLSETRPTLLERVTKYFRW